MLHPSLPQSLTPESLASWLKQNCKESFQEEKRYQYTEDELNDFRLRVTNCGIEISDLEVIKKRVAELVEKGIGDFTQVDVLPSKGIKQLKLERASCEQAVKRGYESEIITIYGIPNHDTNNMDYFDIEGNEIVDRRRPLSAKESRDFLGLFNPNLKAS